MNDLLLFWLTPPDWEYRISGEILGWECSFAHSFCYSGIICSLTVESFRLRNRLWFRLQMPARICFAVSVIYLVFNKLFPYFGKFLKARWHSEMLFLKIVVLKLCVETWSSFVAGPLIMPVSLRSLYSVRLQPSISAAIKALIFWRSATIIVIWFWFSFATFRRRRHPILLTS